MSDEHVVDDDATPAPDGERAEKLAFMLELIVERATRTGALEGFRDKFGVTRETALEYYRDALSDGAGGDTSAEARKLVACRLHNVAQKAERAGDFRSATAAYSALGRMFSGETSMTLKAKRPADEEPCEPPPALFNMTEAQIATWLATGKLPPQELLERQGRGGVVEVPALAPPPADAPIAREPEPIGTHDSRVRRWAAVVREDALTPEDLGPAGPRIFALDPKLRPAVLAQDMSDAVLARAELPARWSVLMRRFGEARLKELVGFSLASMMRSASTDRDRKRVLAQFGAERLEELENEANLLGLVDPRC